MIKVMNFQQTMKRQMNPQTLQHDFPESIVTQFEVKMNLQDRVNHIKVPEKFNHSMSLEV